jgi:hypothetical protein
MGVRIEGHVMVHRTDIAGSCMGQASLRRDGRCRLTLSVPVSKTARQLSNGKRCRVLTAALHAIYLELQTL